MLTLTLACAAYDRTRPLIDGRVAIEGVDLRATTLHPEAAFARAKAAEFDLTELSLSGHLRSLDAGNPAYAALPVFPSRAFRHSGIYVHAGKGIRSPSDLRGRIIGTPDYKTTANVWIRAFLAHDHGIQPHEMQWVEAAMEAGEPGPASATAVPGVPLLALPDKDLAGMLARGDIDAVIGAKVPSCFGAGQDTVARLFPDHQRIEQDYYRRTGFFPIMHVLGLRRELHERHPWLARAVCQGFEAARRVALQDIRDVCQLAATLPWVAAEYQRTVDLMGEDYWPYGLAANQDVLQAFAMYHFQQGLSRRPRDPAAWLVPAGDFFATGVLIMGIRDTDKTLPSNRMVFELRRDAQKHLAFKQDLEGTMAAYGLDEKEKRAWRDMDIEALGAMGVHPYFLPQISRLFKGGARNHNDSDAARLYAEKMGIASKD